jgi:hypothetical protein
LCTFPRRNTAKRQSEYARYPDINFNRWAPFGEPFLFYEYRKVPSVQTLQISLLNRKFGTNIANYIFTYMHNSPIV